MSDEIASRYDAKAVEPTWIARWDESGVFRPESADPKARPFTIVIPPPNVTGRLHMGHALNNTLQDLLVRFRRMQGYAALWVPGTDHAGIATQNVVEKDIAKEGKTRQDLGREAFLTRAWAWKEAYGGAILDQLKKLGCSCDWTRTRFTMDEGLSRAVTASFVRLHDEGLIYRGERLINWCPRCETALSDEEAEVREDNGQFWHLRYPLVDEPTRYLVVATTRPETMLGDVAVAVHPGDERYRSLVGRKLRLPLTGREIPIIADTWADPEKGSGAVKVTPAHDFNDFAVGERHALPRLRIFDDRARVNELGGAYCGLDRFAARKRIVADLEAQGLLQSVEQKVIPLPRCYRCDTVVEPHLSKQWFVRMRPLLEPAAAAVEGGRIPIRPVGHTKTYLDWVEQYRDWCISRQIWWGHRIPVWYDADDVAVASEVPLSIGARHPKTGKPIVRQDDDVLDTWFSSQLWSLSVVGWPDETPDLARHYPTDVLVTARDIIYFWVARMVMSGLHFRDAIPFHTVYINGTILDAIGRRMSKSLGNGIDPLEMGDRYGMDAVRWTIVSLTTEGQDIKLAESRFEGGRNFVNKLWNASRFVLMNLGDERPKLADQTLVAAEDRWILSELRSLVRDVTAAYEGFRFHESTQRLYDFTWNLFCDWYLELSKSRLNDASPAGQASKTTAHAVLVHVLDQLLHLLHPIIPFVTEEIRTKLSAGNSCLAGSRWPTDAGLRDDADAAAEIARLIALVRAARTVRDRMGLSKSQAMQLVVTTRSIAIADSLRSVGPRAVSLAKLEAVLVRLEGEKPAQSITIVEDSYELHVPLAGLIDLSAEISRLTKEAELAATSLAALRGKLQNPGFLAKAKPEVVAQEQAREAELSDKLERLRATLNDLGSA